MTGMIAGFVCYDGGRVDVLDGEQAVAKAAAQPGAVLWVDLEQPGDAELRAVGRLFRLAPEAIDDCQSGEQHPRIDEYDDHIFLVLYGAVGVEETAEFCPRKLAAFCGARFLVTVEREPLRTVRAVRERCRKAAAPLIGRGADFVLYSIIDGMADRYLHLAESYEDRIEELEEASMDPEVEPDLLGDVGELRRLLLEIRRLVVSQRELLTPLARGEYEYVSERLSMQFRHVADHLTQVRDETDSMRERLHGVRDNYHVALANRTNDIVKTLTLFATVLLPMGVLAGIYGMNLPLWPPPDHPLSFWAVLGMMVLVAGGFALYFKRKKWL